MSFQVIEKEKTASVQEHSLSRSGSKFFEFETNFKLESAQASSTKDNQYQQQARPAFATSPTKKMSPSPSEFSDFFWSTKPSSPSFMAKSSSQSVLLSVADTYQSDIEQTILRANEPIIVDETEEISLPSGESGIWVNRAEV